MLIDKVRVDLQTATKNRDLERVAALRLLISALSYLEKSGKEITQADELAVLKSEVKKRREAIEAYQSASRAEKVAEEQGELEVIETYLPEQASDDEIRVVVEKLVKETGGENRGQIIGKVMAEIGKEKTDGNTVARIVNEVLK